MTPMNRPPKTTGLRHVALSVHKLEACVKFYTELFGMKIEWKPDPDNVYLTSGNDNLALHRSKHVMAPHEQQKLDHLGFIIDKIEEVDQWHEFLSAQDIHISKIPKTHRDGARSFYCSDPDGNNIQLIYHPPLSSSRK